MSEQASGRGNWFVRSLIIVFCLFLLALVSFKFFLTDPKAEISGGLLVLVAFILVLVLSELFDNFSIGELVRVSRLAEKKEAEKAELKKENSELRNNIVAISNSFSQRQTSTNIVGIPPDLASKLYAVVPASDGEAIAEKREEVQREQDSAQVETPASPRIDEHARRESARRAEEWALWRFSQMDHLREFNFIPNAQLASQFHGIDPVSNNTPLFAGYIKTLDSEVFIETLDSNRTYVVFRERLYFMLYKIHLYRSLKNSNAYLSLVMYSGPSRARAPSTHTVERLHKDFEPAITSGLLRMTYVPVSEEEQKTRPPAPWLPPLH